MVLGLPWVIRCVGRECSRLVGGGSVRGLVRRVFRQVVRGSGFVCVEVSMMIKCGKTEIVYR